MLINILHQTTKEKKLFTNEKILIIDTQKYMMRFLSTLFLSLGVTIFRNNQHSWLQKSQVEADDLNRLGMMVINAKYVET